MQHPDEGMIHTWLDGQLSAEEATRLETHFAECPQCAAKVAEERGLVAGATRILTALDNVPADVIPIAAKSKRSSRGFLQAAAAILVVVTGGVIAVRVSGNDIRIPTAATVAPVDTQSTALQSTVVRPPSTVTAESKTARAPSTLTADSKTARAPVPARSNSKSPSTNTAVAADGRRAADARVRPPTATIEQSFAPATASGAIGSAVVAPAPPPPIQVPREKDTIHVSSVSSRDQVQLGTVVTTGVAAVSPPKLTVVRSEAIEGGRVILLRTQSGNIVTLTESAQPTSQPVAEAAPQNVRSVDGARGTASSTQAVIRGRDSAIRTIAWRDATTGRFYTLRGAFSEGELREMKARIEAEPALRK